MVQKWNLQDIVPPDRVRRSKPPQRGGAPAQEEGRRIPPREMHVGGNAFSKPRAQSPVRESAPPVHQRPTSQPPVGGRGYTRAETYEPEPEEEMVATGEETYQDYSERDPADSVVARLEVTDGKLARVRRFIFVGVACAIVGFVGLSATILLSGAEVTVLPKTHETTVQASFEAKLKPAVGDLGYELLTLEEEGERQVPAKGTEEVSLKAEGEITVFNGHSATPQKLVKSTRFEAPGGLIYRITDGITIPGYKKDAGGSLVPGSVKVKVVADGTGENYNISDVRLSVPGLKGTDQFSSIYGEVSKAGIAGGFEGTKFIIDETELATVKQKLHTELRDKLLARIVNERPNGFVLYDSAVTFMYDSLPSASANDQTAVIKERARLMVPLFNEAAFATFVAKSAVPGYGGEPVRLENAGALVFAYEQSILDDIAKVESIPFSLTGTAKLIWKFDEESLKKDLIGTREKDLETTLAKYPSISKAKAIIRPMWKNSFPTTPEDIKVTEVTEMP